FRASLQAEVERLRRRVSRRAARRCPSGIGAESMGEVAATMPAAVINGLRDVAIEERPTPQPGPGELLLEISHFGLCGSDLHFLLEWGPQKAGSIEGHEYSGTVVAVGPDVTGWQVGDRSVGGPSPRCGHCEYCLAGRSSLCIERGRVGSDEGE